ncbi:hypothetical protein [Parablautia intestinalis]|nr:hypothetical protein [Parablautia intestinalis]
MIENEYRHNKRFREYVEKYCSTHGCTVDEALKHEVVRQACLYYTDV